MITIYVDNMHLHFIKAKLPRLSGPGCGLISKVGNLGLLVALKLFRLTNIINYQRPSLLQKQLTLEIFAGSPPQREVFGTAAPCQQVFRGGWTTKFEGLV
jgi:hypothetical protein